MRLQFKTGDIFIYIFIILLVAGSFLGLKIMERRSGDQLTVIIEIDGETIGSYQLTEGMEPRQIRVDTGNGGYNTIRLSWEGVDITESNCRDQICVKWGRIRAPGQSIICLPHRLVLKIVGTSDEEPPVDATAS